MAVAQRALSRVQPSEARADDPCTPHSPRVGPEAQQCRRTRGEPVPPRCPAGLSQAASGRPSRGRWRPRRRAPTSSPDARCGSGARAHRGPLGARAWGSRGEPPAQADALPPGPVGGSRPGAAGSGWESRAGRAEGDGKPQPQGAPSRPSPPGLLGGGRWAAARDDPPLPWRPISLAAPEVTQETHASGLGPGSALHSGRGSLGGAKRGWAWGPAQENP